MKLHPNQTCVEPGHTRLDYYIAGLATVTGGTSVAYCLHDLAHPNHFVGDMYGLEVLMRLPIILVPALSLLLAIVIMLLGSTRLPWAGRLAVRCVVLALVIMTAGVAIHTAAERAAWSARESYPQLPVTELLRLAREKEDQFAIDALAIKGDPSAVPGLLEILLDEKMLPRIRSTSADTLSLIPGPEAKAALEQARTTIRDPQILQAIQYRLDASTSPSTSPP